MADEQSECSRPNNGFIVKALIELHHIVSNSRDTIKKQVQSFNDVIENCVKQTDKSLHDAIVKVRRQLPLTKFCKKTFIFDNTELNSSQVHSIILRAVKALKGFDKKLKVETLVMKLERAILEYGDNLENALYFAEITTEKHFQKVWETFREEVKLIKREEIKEQENKLKVSIEQGKIPIMRSLINNCVRTLSLYERTTEIDFLLIGKSRVAYYKPGRYVGPQDNTSDLYESADEEVENRPSRDRHQSYSHQLFDLRSNVPVVTEAIRRGHLAIANILDTFDDFFKDTIKLNLNLLQLALSHSRDAVIQILCLTLELLSNSERTTIILDKRLKMEENLDFTVSNINKISDATTKILEKLGPLKCNEDNIENIEKERVAEWISNLVDIFLQEMGINISVQNVILLETLKRKGISLSYRFGKVPEKAEKKIPEYFEDLRKKDEQFQVELHEYEVPFVIREIMSEDIYNYKLFFTNIDIEMKNMMKLILERALKSLAGIENIIFVYLCGLEKCAELMLSAWKCYAE